MGVNTPSRNSSQKLTNKSRRTPATPTRVISVAPITGSFSSLPGESEAFHYGTPILDVSVGNAKLVVPIGRTLDLIGATFDLLDFRLGPTPSSMQTSQVLFPGAAETVFIQNFTQFKLQSSTIGPDIHRNVRVRAHADCNSHTSSHQTFHSMDGLLSGHVVFRFWGVDKDPV